MNSFDSRTPVKRNLKPLLLAVALSVPASAVMAAAMDDVVKTRADQNVDEQYGRDSVYAFSTEAKPLKPEQTESRDTNFFGTMKSYAADAWHKTEGFASGVWGKTTGFFHDHTPASASTAAQLEPQGYGRAGGFVGSERIAILDSDAPNQANAALTDSALSGMPAPVQTGTASAPADALGGPSSESADALSDSDLQSR